MSKSQESGEWRISKIDTGDTNSQNQVTPKMIQESTNRKALIAAQLSKAQVPIQVTGQLRARSVKPGYHSFAPEKMGNISLIAGNLVGISALKNNPKIVMEGKFFLCRTITPAIQTGEIETVVEDPEGVDAVRLALHKYSEAKSASSILNSVLPMGSYLAVKNPWFKTETSMHGTGLIVRCDNPSDLVLLSEMAANEIVNDWRTQVCDDTFKLPPFWENLMSDSNRLEKLKENGNRLFKEQLFPEAIRFYNLGLEYAENSQLETLNNNKAAALLQLGCRNAALECAEKALKINPENAKAIYRKARSLIGSGDLVEANEFLRHEIDKYPGLQKNVDLIKIIKQCQDMKRLMENPSEMKQYLWTLKLDKKTDDFLPEFRGPIETASIPGKGRGIIATKDLKPGDLVLVSKAFVNVTEPRDEDQFSVLLELKSIRNKVELEPCHDKVVGRIANKILFDTKLGQEFYNLTAGKDLGHFEKDDLKNDFVDLERIDAIVSLNAFGNGDSFNEENNRTGVWILPSFFNHSCSGMNCFYQIVGDFMFIQTTKEVRKGEELLIGYMDIRKDFQERKRICESFEFICSCHLCKLEATEPKDNNGNGKLMLRKLEEMLAKEKPDLTRVIILTKALANLRKKTPKLNMVAINMSLIVATSSLFNSGKYMRELIPIYEKILNVAESYYPECHFHVMVVSNIIVCYIKYGDMTEVKKWVKRMKEILVKWFGSIQFLSKITNKSLLKLFEEVGIELFA